MMSIQVGTVSPTAPFVLVATDGSRYMVICYGFDNVREGNEKQYKEGLRVIKEVKNGLARKCS